MSHELIDLIVLNVLGPFITTLELSMKSILLKFWFGDLFEMMRARFFLSFPPALYFSLKSGSFVSQIFLPSLQIFELWEKILNAIVCFFFLKNHLYKK